MPIALFRLARILRVALVMAALGVGPGVAAETVTAGRLTMTSKGLVSVRIKPITACVIWLP
jgi:hypothetical protein